MSSIDGWTTGRWKSTVVGTGASSLRKVAPGIYLRRDGDLVRMSERVYATEAELQELVARHPDLLPPDGEPRRWFRAARSDGAAETAWQAEAERNHASGVGRQCLLNGRKAA
jgi:hypothetical protein